MKFLNNVVETLKSHHIAEDSVDKADLVQTILIVAGFGIVAILAVNWIGTAVLNKGADTAACIEGSATYETNSDVCQAQYHPYSNSFDYDSGYTSRYGANEHYAEVAT